jgi:putative ABC transport system substrate-binding protein
LIHLSPRLSRRALLATTVATLFALSGARAQQMPRMAKVGVLPSSTEATFAANVEVFRTALRELGWIEGQNLKLEVRYANAYPQLPILAAELVALNVDVIFAMGSPATKAAKQTTAAIPIVMETLGDAVSAGLVTNLSRPGSNVTGISGFAPEMTGKQLELIREILPQASRVAVLANRDNEATKVIIRATSEVAARIGVQLEVVTVRQPADLEAAFVKIARWRADALLVATDPMFSSQRLRIVELAARHRIPAAYQSGLFAEAGGLLSYGLNTSERFRRAAVYVDQILKGAKAGDLPVEQPRVFELKLNLKTARTLGLELPSAVRLRATDLID